MTDVTCTRCGQTGHRASHCPWPAEAATKGHDPLQLVDVDATPALLLPDPPARPGFTRLDSLPLRRGVATVDDLRRRSWIDPLDRDPYSPCWHWRGAMAADGTSPRIWAFDHAIGDKRAMTGSEAAWNISKGASPKPGLAYRRCFCADCVNPEHLRWARDKAEMGLAMRAAGVRKGMQIESRRANVLKAQIAAGCAPAAPEIVRAVRAAPEIVSGRELAALFGISQQSVSRMRRGESHRGVA